MFLSSIFSLLHSHQILHDELVFFSPTPVVVPGRSMRLLVKMLLFGLDPGPVPVTQMELLPSSVLLAQEEQHRASIQTLPEILHSSLEEPHALKRSSIIESCCTLTSQVKLSVHCMKKLYSKRLSNFFIVR